MRVRAVVAFAALAALACPSLRADASDASALQAKVRADDTIIIGSQVYGSKGGAWDVQTWSQRLVDGFEGDFLDVGVVSLGPDQGPSGTFVMKDSYGGPNDPAIAIPAPANAKRLDG